MTSKPFTYPPEIFTETFWDRAPSKEQGDTLPDALFCAVGRALTAWEWVEQAQGGLFLTLTGVQTADSLNAVRRAYGSIFGNSGRRTALTAAAEVYFGGYWAEKSVRRRFNLFNKAIELASKRRDDITHAGVITSIKIDNIDKGGFLMPLEYNTKFTHAFPPLPLDHLSFTGKYRFTSEDILQWTKRFDFLRNAIWDLQLKLRRTNEGIPLIAEMIAAGEIGGK